jgi:hypothetical protein
VLALPDERHGRRNINRVVVMVVCRATRVRGLLSVLVRIGVGGVVVVLVVVTGMRCRPEEVPVDMRGPLVPGGFADTCAGVGMGEAHSLEEQSRHQE